MFVLLSGEGPTDMGAPAPFAGDGSVLVGDEFLPGPMALIAAMIIQAKCHDSLLDHDCGFVRKKSLGAKTEMLRPVPKSIGLPGAKRPRETREFFDNARALGLIAGEEATSRPDEVVAILFHDADGTASAGRGEWAAKRQSMLDGFEAAGFERGVPMIPKPKSEAWLICALKPAPYLSCEALEARSGNDRSPKSLKSELEAILGEAATRETLNTLVEDGSVDCVRIEMPSFTAFRERLVAVLERLGSAS